MSRAWNTGRAIMATVAIDWLDRLDGSFRPCCSLHSSRIQLSDNNPTSHPEGGQRVGERVAVKLASAQYPSTGGSTPWFRFLPADLFVPAVSASGAWCCVKYKCVAMLVVDGSQQLAECGKVQPCIDKHHR